jgi:hypothetical protein
MTTRTRGLLLFVGSAVAGAVGYWLLFPGLSARPGAFYGFRKTAAYALALPLVGGAIGLLEGTTGVPISRLDEGWQKLPAYVRGPVAVVGALLFLVGLVKLLGF